MKESNFLLSLPRAPLRRNGDRIFHQLILVIPKPLVGVQSLLPKSIATATMMDERRKYDVPE